MYTSIPMIQRSECIYAIHFVPTNPQGVKTKNIIIDISLPLELQISDQCFMFVQDKYSVSAIVFVRI